ncbi:MAG: alpha/beta hydrolase [Hyphomicrobiales bacterium]|nr:MAG: alpha/beta hydrolase [Hyphomicrobiales bacterium]
MWTLISKAARWSAALLALMLVIFLGARIYLSERGPPLDLWHLYAPAEFSAEEIEATDWAGFTAKEDALFRSLAENVGQKLTPQERVPFNRYFEESPVWPGRFARDWNRSYIMEPAGPPAGAVVLLHGLTDSPYSLRRIAAHYRDRGFVAVGIRLPGHGTTPAALTEADWRQWLAATRLSVREARRRAPAPLPLDIVGFSNGGALAMKYALDAAADGGLAQADRLILVSPMVGVTRFARFAGLAGLPAALPAFAKAAWLAIMPEFNPFKYNSFPVNGARQAYRLTDALSRQMRAAEREGTLGRLPPVLTFQSVMDATVNTRSVLTDLYDHLPENGGELVLFDVNRNEKFGPLLRASADARLSEIAPPRSRTYRLAIVENAGKGTDEAQERVVEAGQTDARTRRLGLFYPKGVFSLSHVALPFPLTDQLYGLTPDGSEDFGVTLGALAPRGERGALIVSLDALLRMSSNPFFPYLLERIDAFTGLPAAPAESETRTAPPPAPPPPARSRAPKRSGRQT